MSRQNCCLQPACGIPIDEAAGIELVRGLQARHAAEDVLLNAALPLFDALYADMKARQ